MSDKKVLIGDFDGAFTDNAAEVITPRVENGPTFQDVFIKELLRFLEPLGWTREQVQEKLEEKQYRIRSAAHEYGWVVDGKIVAHPGDSFLQVKPAARLLFEEVGDSRGEKVPGWFLDGLLDLFYQAGYPHTGICFRDGAYQLLQFFHQNQGVIITNSGTDAVKNKIMQLINEGYQENPDDLLMQMLDSVYGAAKKYIVHNRPPTTYPDMPESIQMDGLGRPIYLWRNKYVDLLNEIRGNTPWEHVIGYGDIFELDGAVIVAAGGTFVQLQTEFTPPYEIQYFSSHPRIYLVQSLAEAQEVLAGLLSD